MKPWEYFCNEMLLHYRTNPGFCFHSVRNPKQNETSGNHHVINAVAHKIFFWLYNSGTYIAMTSWRVEAAAFIEACRDAATGEFNRTPTKFEDQAHDDLIAIASSSWRLNLKYGKEIYEQGNKWRWVPTKVLGIKFKIPAKWYFDNTESTPNFQFQNWLGHFFWFQAFIKIAAEKKANPLDRLVLILYFLASVMDHDTNTVSGRQLRYLMTDVIMETKYRVLKWAVALWMKDQQKLYPLGWGDALGRYHLPSDGLEHPFSLWGKLAFDNEFQKNIKDGNSP